MNRVFNDALANIDELRQRACDLVAEAEKIQNAADTAKRVLTADEKKSFDYLMSQYEDVKADIDRRQRLATNAANLEKPQKRLTPSADIQVEDKLKGKCGYNSIGQYAKDARSAQRGQVSD